MPTKHPRINVTLEEETMLMLSLLAKKKSRSVSSMTKELLEEALDLREDKILSTLARMRDVSQAKRVKHADAWK